ncbi:MAG: sugar O-acetyltransferase [Spirochaetaceae bacterium]|jgi:maltose O-acetyltransferase|nr:sugar O-acetyltransferase [Spirochaetaceae bacterium]
MTEKEKMIAEQPYNSMEEELVRERLEAKKALYRYNNLPPEEMVQGFEILRKLFGKTGNSFWIEQPFRCDYGYTISIGENFYANYNCIILDSAPVTIGNNVMLAPNVGIYTAGHPLHFEPRIAGIEYGISVTIGDNVWIGAGAIILPGVTIGSNSVIGAGSVVTKDIPSGVLAAGNPCKVLRVIPEEEREYYFRNRKLPE